MSILPFFRRLSLWKLYRSPTLCPQDAVLNKCLVAVLLHECSTMKRLFPLSPSDVNYCFSIRKNSYSCHTCSFAVAGILGREKAKLYLFLYSALLEILYSILSQEQQTRTHFSFFSSAGTQLISLYSAEFVMLAVFT